MPSNENALEASHWIWAAFDELNARHFDGKLEHPQQILRLSSEAVHGAQSVAGTIWIEGARIDADPGSAKDSLLHEMIHLELLAATSDSDAVHGDRFKARADEIGDALGLLPIGFSPDIEVAARTWPMLQREAARMVRQAKRAADKVADEKKRREREKQKAARRARRNR